MISINQLPSICMECKEVIHNPICSDCLANEINEWMKDKDKRMTKYINNEISEVIARGEFALKERCIKCKEKAVFLCPYCFIELVYRRLKTIRANNKNLCEFLTMFNFNFKHTYLEKEAERLKML